MRTAYNLINGSRRHGARPMTPTPPRVPTTAPGLVVLDAELSDHRWLTPVTTRPIYVRPVVQKELYDQLDANGEGRNTAQRALVLAPIDAIGALCYQGHHQRHATGPAMSAEDQPRRGSGWAATLPALYAKWRPPAHCRARPAPHWSGIRSGPGARRRRSTIDRV